MTDAALQAIVRKWQPLLVSLVTPRGQDFHYAAIWGQIPQESRDNPAAEEFAGSEHGGKGWWEHTGPRFTSTQEDFSKGVTLGLRAFAARLGKPWRDEEAQVRFVAYEINNSPQAKHAWAQTLKTSNVTAATGTFMYYFEAPAGKDQELVNPGTTTANLPRRLDGANEALAAILAAKAKEKTVTDLDLSSSDKTPAQKVDDIHAVVTRLEQRVEAGFEQLAQKSNVPMASTAVSIVEAGLNMLLPRINPGLEQEISANQLALFIVRGADALLARLLPPPGSNAKVIN